MSFDRKLLDIVCCPATHLPLRLMPEPELTSLNARIAAGTVRYRDDTPVTQPIEQALITEDDRLAYAIEDDIPVLLEDRGILITPSDAP